LVNDVACFNCNGTSGFKYPPLRNFNPYYGHSWADGAAYGGNNQESTSEAINFEVGLIELGEQTKNDQWRDLGLYLYEQEMLATQQYWFNQDADLTDNQHRLPNRGSLHLRKLGPTGLLQRELATRIRHLQAGNRQFHPAPHAHYQAI
jgi:endoglucanase Acf2